MAQFEGYGDAERLAALRRRVTPIVVLEPPDYARSL